MFRRVSTHIQNNRIILYFHRNPSILILTMCIFRTRGWKFQSMDHNGPRMDGMQHQISHYSNYTDFSSPPEFVCTFSGCSYKTRIKSNFTRHQKTIHAENVERFACPVCGDQKQYSSKYTLKLHMRSMHKDSLLTCDRCYRQFITPTLLAEHMRLVHNVPEDT